MRYTVEKEFSRPFQQYNIRLKVPKFAVENCKRS